MSFNLLGKIASAHIAALREATALSSDALDKTAGAITRAAAKLKALADVTKPVVFKKAPQNKSIGLEDVAGWRKVQQPKPLDVQGVPYRGDDLPYEPGMRRGPSRSIPEGRSEEYRRYLQGK